MRKLILAFALTLGLAGCPAKWDPTFKQELMGAVAINLLMGGATPEYVQPMAKCMVDEAERLVPSQSEMQRIASGEVDSPVADKVFRKCACAIDPAAKAHPTFCKR